MITKKILTITVSGEKQSGKSTMQRTIADHLESLGYQVDATKENTVTATYPIVVNDPVKLATPTKV